ncbi:hypothetical protein JDN40_04195 [Rhodomicrobium vannielii ATCC 17100]|uniref:hypothetical protein n=1 Tax=Rhodomicrobium vannielii TaxID=1069 RepID=UPI001918E2BA|nr:hypothetical protein [Rhodomicrobium vannielii]MBJ7533308.1 hypothetical protein [Rhodomicrobium vannielii ATCC 17100]
MNLTLRASHRIPARRFIIYLPDNNRYGERIDNIEDWVREACLLLTRINGGATRLAPAQGLWLNEEDNRLITETTHIVFSCVTGTAFLQNLELIRAFIARFSRETSQESVAVEFDGSIYFISDDAIAGEERQRERVH